MQVQAIEKIIERYLEGKASIDEIAQLEEWYNSFDCESELYRADSAELKQALSDNFSALKKKLGID